MVFPLLRGYTELTGKESTWLRCNEESLSGKVGVALRAQMIMYQGEAELPDLRQQRLRESRKRRSTGAVKQRFDVESNTRVKLDFGGFQLSIQLCAKKQSTINEWIPFFGPIRNGPLQLSISVIMARV